MNSKPTQVQVIVEKDAITASVSTDNHAFIIDEPEEVGGGNLGPDPYEALLGALGACTAITLRMYATNKQWPLEKITVRLSHRKKYLQDCQHCEQDSSKLDHVEIVLSLEGNLSEQQLDRLTVIAGKCPVHKTLSSGLQITSSLAATAG